MVGNPLSEARDQGRRRGSWGSVTGIFLVALKTVKAVFAWVLLVFVWMLAALYLLDGINCLVACPIDEEEARRLAVWEFEQRVSRSGYKPEAFVGPRLAVIQSPFGVSRGCEGDWGVVLIGLLFTHNALICGHDRDPFMYTFTWTHVDDPKIWLMVSLERCGWSYVAGLTLPPADASLPPRTRNGGDAKDD